MALMNWFQVDRHSLVPQIVMNTQMVPHQQLREDADEAALGWRQAVSNHRHRHVRTGTVTGSSADKGEHQHQQDSGGLRPAGTGAEGVAGEDTPGNDQGDPQYRQAGDPDAGHVEAVIEAQQ